MGRKEEKQALFQTKQFCKWHDSSKLSMQSKLQHLFHTDYFPDAYANSMRRFGFHYLAQVAKPKQGLRLGFKAA
jgi:hypothetical protein